MTTGAGEGLRPLDPGPNDGLRREWVIDFRREWVIDFTGMRTVTLDSAGATETALAAPRGRGTPVVRGRPHPPRGERQLVRVHPADPRRRGPQPGRARRRRATTSPQGLASRPRRRRWNCGATCGVHPVLGHHAAPGTSLREAWRMADHRDARGRWGCEGARRHQEMLLPRRREPGGGARRRRPGIYHRGLMIRALGHPPVEVGDQVSGPRPARRFPSSRRGARCLRCCRRRPHRPAPRRPAGAGPRPGRTGARRASRADWPGPAGCGRHQRRREPTAAPFRMSP